MAEIRTARNHLFRFLLLALLLVVPFSARADSLSPADYQNQLRRAIQALEDLQKTDETEHPAYDQHQLEQTIKTVTEALPEHEDVKASDDVCNVDNSWLTIALKDFEGATIEQRPKKLAQLIERLKALEERVAYEQRPATAADGKAQAKEKLDGILARPEYATESRGPNALMRLIQNFIRWILSFLPERMPVRSGGSRWLAIVAEGLVVIVAAIVIFYVLRILFARFHRPGKRRAAKKREARIVLGERLEPEETATDLLSEAEALARRGDIRAAIRKAYIALLVELGDRKVLTLAQHKTNRDYLNAVRSIPLLHPTMRTLTESFERHWYGVTDATENDWQTFRARYQAALQTQN